MNLWDSSPAYNFYDGLLCNLIHVKNIQQFFDFIIFYEIFCVLLFGRFFSSIFFHFCLKNNNIELPLQVIFWLLKHQKFKSLQPKCLYKKAKIVLKNHILKEDIIPSQLLLRFHYQLFGNVSKCIIFYKMGYTFVFLHFLYSFKFLQYVRL